MLQQRALSHLSLAGDNGAEASVSSQNPGDLTHEEEVLRKYLGKRRVPRPAAGTTPARRWLRPASSKI